MIRLTTILCAGAMNLSAQVFSISHARAAEPHGEPLAAARAPNLSQPVVTDIRVAGDGRQTRFIITFDRKIDFAVFTLADPYRVVIDLPQVTFKVPPQTGEQGRGLVKVFRFGLMMQGGSRIVLDMTGPTRVEQAFALEGTDAQPARLVLNLLPTDRESFMRNIALENRPVFTPTHRIDAGPKNETDPRPLIVLDPGHGGIDTGTKGLEGQNEKDVVLAFAHALRDQLERGNKYRVAMTRSDDSFIPLNERMRFARQQKAALFISLHADSLPRRESQVEGASVYILSEEASDAEAAAIAEAENKSDALAGIDLAAEPNDVANILIDLAQRETKTFSLQFARALAGELKTASPLHKNPLKSAGFVVLKAPDVPSVLVELGYMSSRDDLKRLTSPDWRKRAAAAAVRAIDTYLGAHLAGSNGRAQ